MNGKNNITEQQQLEVYPCCEETTLKKTYDNPQ